MEIMLYVVGAIVAVGVGFGLPLALWAKQRKQTMGLIEEIEGRLQFHRSYYEALQRETSPIFHTLDKRVTRSLYEAYLILSMVGELLEQFHQTLEAPLADLSTVRAQLQLLTGAGSVISAAGETMALSSLSGWDGRIELRLAFVKSQIERVKARRAQSMHQVTQLQQVAQSR